MIDYSVRQLLLVPLGVLGACTLSGKTGITTTALFMATTSVVPHPTATLMTISLAHVARSLLLAAAMLRIAAVMLSVMLVLLVMVSIAASHLPAE